KVWLARDLFLNRPVALKTFRGSGGDLGPKLLALQNEARILAQFRHPHLVEVHAWRRVGCAHYLVLQYVPGGSLERRVRAEGALCWTQAARYVADVGEGLMTVHAQGVVHRDVKPGNLLWDPTRDEALLTDFGVSALLSSHGGVAGTPLYMAPEAF